jgi:hypothetical protein
MNAGDKAAQHLTLAWNAVDGRQPDPGKGYGEAIKAMEVATIPVVFPGNLRAKLGRVINHLWASQASGQSISSIRPPTGRWRSSPTCWT